MKQHVHIYAWFFCVSIVMQNNSMYSAEAPSESVVNNETNINKNRWTDLHEAVNTVVHGSEDPETVRSLLSQPGIDVNARTPKRQTALSLALDFSHLYTDPYNQTEVVRLLLNHPKIDYEMPVGKSTFQPSVPCIVQEGTSDNISPFEKAILHILPSSVELFIQKMGTKLKARHLQLAYQQRSRLYSLNLEKGNSCQLTEFYQKSHAIYECIDNELKRIRRKSQLHN